MKARPYVLLLKAVLIRHLIDAQQFHAHPEFVCYESDGELIAAIRNRNTDKVLTILLVDGPDKWTGRSNNVDGMREAIERVILKPMSYQLNWERLDSVIDGYSEKQVLSYFGKIAKRSRKKFTSPSGQHDYETVYQNTNYDWGGFDPVIKKPEFEFENDIHQELWDIAAKGKLRINKERQDPFTVETLQEQTGYSEQFIKQQLGEIYGLSLIHI